MLELHVSFLLDTSPEQFFPDSFSYNAMKDFKVEKKIIHQRCELYLHNAKHHNRNS